MLTLRHRFSHTHTRFQLLPVDYVKTVIHVLPYWASSAEISWHHFSGKLGKELHNSTEANKDQPVAFKAPGGCPLYHHHPQKQQFRDRKRWRDEVVELVVLVSGFIFHIFFSTNRWSGTKYGFKKWIKLSLLKQMRTECLLQQNYSIPFTFIFLPWSFNGMHFLVMWHIQTRKFCVMWH